jgi:hypothetical protein
LGAPDGEQSRLAEAEERDNRDSVEVKKENDLESLLDAFFSISLGKSDFTDRYTESLGDALKE